MTGRGDERAARDLAAIVGAAHVRPAGSGDAVEGRVPGWVVSPGTVEEVSRCLRLAHAEHLAVAPAGAGTRRHWGNAPERLDLLLSLRRLDRVVEHAAADLTVSVEAGVTLRALDAAVRSSGQHLPLDPPRRAGSTVGGLIATAASGPYRVRYGTMRELLLGLTVVAADGTVLTGGGRVVKNVTGYDMPKLHVGALGTLGVVVAAHLRLHAVSPIEETWLYGFPSHEAALDAALGVLDSPIVPSRVQTVDEGVLGAPNDAPTAGLAVTIGSVAEGVRAQGDRLRDIARRHGGVSLRGAGAGWWERWSAATWVEDPARQLTARLGCRPTDLVKARRSVEAALGGHGQLAATAGVASGVLHLVVTLREGHDGAGLIPRMRERVDALGATLVVEHAPPEVKATLDAWGDVGPTIGIMRRLKAELDPRRILNPGRFVGGI